jgi:hypothetical protein
MRRGDVMMDRLLALPRMQHLDPERLAALHEDPPTADERAHLASCVVCRREQDAFAALADLALAEGARGLPDIVHIAAAPSMPLTRWDALRPVLIAEGLLTSGSHDVSLLAAPVVPRTSYRWAWQAAAALALVVSGALLGRLTAPADRAVSSTIATADDSTFTSPADAQAALLRAQTLYESASSWLAVNDTTTHSSDVYRARLAALDDMLATSREALRTAPTDPVLNQYYLNAASARETTLRQLGGALPVMQTIDSY